MKLLLPLKEVVLIGLLLRPGGNLYTVSLVVDQITHINPKDFFWKPGYITV